MGQFDPAQRHGAGASYGPVITTATERMVATAMELGDAAIPAALLREIRLHGLADRATIWQRGTQDWVLQRSLGGATPDPEAATAEGWRTVGLETFSLGHGRALVVAGPAGFTAEAREDARSLVEALAALAGALLTGPHRSAAMDDTDLVPPRCLAPPPGNRTGTGHATRPPERPATAPDRRWIFRDRPGPDGASGSGRSQKSPRNSPRCPWRRPIFKRERVSARSRMRVHREVAKRCEPRRHPGSSMDSSPRAGEASVTGPFSCPR